MTFSRSAEKDSDPVLVADAGAAPFSGGNFQLEVPNRDNNPFANPKLDAGQRSDSALFGLSPGSADQSGSLWFSAPTTRFGYPLPSLEVGAGPRLTGGDIRFDSIFPASDTKAPGREPQVVSRLNSWQTLYQPVRGEGGDKGSTPPGGGPPVHLPDHTLQKFLADPVKAGYAAAAGDPRTANGKYGTMFRIAEMNNDAFFQQMTGMSKDAWIKKHGDAYKEKYGFDLTGVHFRVVDTGSAIKGKGRVDLCVDKGTARTAEMEAFNSPNVKHSFSMEVLDTRIDGDGKPTTRPRPEGGEPRRRNEPVERPARPVRPPRESGEPVQIPEWQKLTDQQAITSIEDPKASFKDKAAAFTRLYEQGEKLPNGRVRVALNDNGVKRNFDIERLSLGKDTKLMQVVSADQNGQEHPVLRWTERNGKLEQQKNRTGSVDFHGSWWSANMPQSTVAQYGERGGVTPPVKVVPDQPVRVPTDKPVKVQPKEVLPPVTLEPGATPMALDAVTDKSILNDVSRRPNGEKLEPTYIGYQGTITYADARGRRQVQGDQPLWLDKPAAQALAIANKMLEEKGKRVILASEGTLDQQNSAGRTHTQQRIAQGKAAATGRSWHEKGSAMDIRNFKDPDVDRALRAVGFVGKNIHGDEWHYQFEQPQKASKLWAQYGDQIQRDIETRRRK